MKMILKQHSLHIPIFLSRGPFKTFPKTPIFFFVRKKKLLKNINFFSGFPWRIFYHGVLKNRPAKIWSFCKILRFLINRDVNKYFKKINDFWFLRRRRSLKFFLENSVISSAGPLKMLLYSPMFTRRSWNKIFWKIESFLVRRSFKIITLITIKNPRFMWLLSFRFVWKNITLYHRE